MTHPQPNILPLLPIDNWIALVRRAINVALRHDGASFLYLDILVNQEGIPECWSEPRIIEMVAGSFKSTLTAPYESGAAGTAWQGVPLVWKLIVQRCILAARKQEGLALVTMRVLVNQRGVPQLWSEPRLIRLEPKSRVTTDWLNDKLSQEDLKRILVALGS